MDTYTLAVNNLKQAITTAINKAIEKGELPQAEIPQFIIETPADRSHGDFATNAAMAGAKSFRMPPFKIAQAITSNLELENTMCERFETAGPGFINFFLGSEFYSNAVREILASSEKYGRSDFGQGEKVMVEFVSANPTGPMHMGNARGGALGDCLAAVLDKAGYDVNFMLMTPAIKLKSSAALLKHVICRFLKVMRSNFPRTAIRART